MTTLWLHDYFIHENVDYMTTLYMSLHIRLHDYFIHENVDYMTTLYMRM
jgi:hypothetical protein